ncbi:hypothetical protein V6N13_067658 [Hibiscus sabdariffa]|uniref:Uncharacterized protein n=1 Tax=Hibiscus sabdariffa TaxID=183260 RepID=A0ABR2DV77_9ROSI
MAACDFVGENGRNKNEENPVRSTAMRKRMASEISDYNRFPRRTLLASDNNMACSFTTLYETLSTHRLMFSFLSISIKFGRLFTLATEPRYSTRIQALFFNGST